jgi:photosystem II stability/assembly factor-like uncharacterized protein
MSMKRSSFQQQLFSWVVIIFLSACGANITETEEVSEQEINPEERVIQLFADQTQLQAGECTIIHWDVPFDAIVQLGDQIVETAGEKEICIETSRIITLTVNNGERIETHELEFLIHDRNQTEETLEPGKTSPETPAFESGGWVSTGGPPGGLGYDIRMDPRNPDIMYVTDAWAGAFKSLDGGSNWFPINNGITTRAGLSGDAIPVFSLTIDPNHPDTIWVGTQSSSGVFRSDNGGESWVEMNTGGNGILEKSLSIRGFSVEPGNSNVVYFAGEVSSWEWNPFPIFNFGLDATKGVVYKTSDSGQNWQRIWKGDNLARYVWINPQDHDLIYVSTGIFDRSAANSDGTKECLSSRNLDGCFFSDITEGNDSYLDPGGVGILRSRDGGKTWQELNMSNGIQPDELYFGSLFMHPENSKILLAAAGNGVYPSSPEHPLGAIYLTEDGGDHWQRVLELHNASIVEICQSDPRVMYAGSINGIYRSMDGGHNWQEVSGGLWGSDDVLAGFPIDAQCDPRNPMRIFINNYIGGNFLSEDGGVSWKISSRGYTGALLRQVALAGWDSSRILSAGRMGVFTSMDGGNNWQGTAHGPARVPEAKVVAGSPMDADTILAVIQDGGPNPKLSRDGGQSWVDIDTGLWHSGEPSSGSVTRIIFSESEPDLVLATAGEMDCYQIHEACMSNPGFGIIRSTDGGETWSRTNLTSEQVADVKFFNDTLVYAAVFPADIYISSDAGRSWQKIAATISDSLPGNFSELKPVITSLAVDKLNDQKLYAGFERSGIMISTDGGKSWVHTSAGMPPESTILDIVVDGTHPDLVYLASPESGVFYTVDGGTTWLSLNQGLLTRTAKDLALSVDGSLLYLATEGGGVFRLGNLHE